MDSYTDRTTQRRKQAEEQLHYSTNPSSVICIDATTYSHTVAQCAHKWHGARSQYSPRLAYCFKVLVVVGFAAYFSSALWYDISTNIGLIVLTSLVVLCCLVKLISDACSERVTGVCSQLKKYGRKMWNNKIRWGLYICSALGLVLFVILDVGLRNPLYLVSLSGMTFFILASFIYSANPRQIPWHTVYTGVVLQVVIGLVVLRWKAGGDAVQWLADIITGFIRFGHAGARYVFGDNYTDHSFAMQVLPMLAWFSSIISTLQHYGIIQVVIAALGGALYLLMGTSPPEAFVAIANIFLGPDGSILMIRSMLRDMSASQIHTLMACGLASIDAGMLPIFESFGIPASQLLSASCMSAPAALLISKMIIPEQDRQEINTKEGPDPRAKAQKLIFDKPKTKSGLEAFSQGATDSIPLIANIAVGLIAAISLLEFVNTTLTWCGDRVGVPEITLQMLLSYPLMPVSFLMGVEWADCGQVGQLIGTKTILNEFIAYLDLAQLIENRHLGVQPQISPRSEEIAAYALCGFSNFGTVGMMVAIMTTLAPNKKEDIVAVAFRSLVASTIACLMTASVAGLLYEG